jgi:hypothetical protein
MHMRRFACALSLWISTVAGPAILAAQVPSRPEHVGSGYVEDLRALTAEMSALYDSGRWTELQDKISGLGLRIARDGPGREVDRPLDPVRNFYLVVFLSRDEAGNVKLVRFAWHKPSLRPYAASIPGRREIYEIVLGAGVDFDLRTGYVSTETEDPVLAEVPRFVKKIEPFLIKIVDRATKRTAEAAANFIVRRVSLPFARAKVRIADQADLTEGMTAWARGVRMLKADFTFQNAPWRRWSFGLVSACLLGTGYAAERVRLTDDGYYADDPPKNPLAAAILSFHPAAYDPDAAAMGWAERLRLFTGVVLEPDMGLCAGAGIGLLRGLAVIGGVAVMGVQTPRDPRQVTVGGRLKTLPGDPDAPFKTAWKAVGFVGMGYSF